MKRKVIPIVEGHGELTAVPTLLRKILHEHHQLWDLQIDRPIRRPRSELGKPDGLNRWITIASKDPCCAGIVVLFDADDDCAAELGPQLREAAQSITDSIPVYVCLAVREYEAWLLASMASLKGRGGLITEPDLPRGGPESIRDAKGWVARNMIPGKTYSETVDQEKLTALLDIQLAYTDSRSFRKLFRDMCDLVERLGATPIPF